MLCLRRIEEVLGRRRHLSRKQYCHWMSQAALYAFYTASYSPSKLPNEILDRNFLASFFVIVVPILSQWPIQHNTKCFPQTYQSPSLKSISANFVLFSLLDACHVPYTYHKHQY